MKYVRLNNNKVVEIIDFNPTGLYHESLIWHECPNESVEQQWTTDGVNFYPPEIQTPTEPVNNTEYLKLMKKNELAALRYQKETAEIEINGTRIRMDRETQSILDSAQRKAESNPDLVVDWKGENGWTDLTSPQIVAIGNAVFSHVQSCFRRERELSELLDVDIETDITTGWPN